MKKKRSPPNFKQKIHENILWLYVFLILTSPLFSFFLKLYKKKTPILSLKKEKLNFHNPHEEACFCFFSHTPQKINYTFKLKIGILRKIA
jgi:hypothetical protein